MNEMSQDRSACRNCGFVFEGRYCNACGQRRVAERLTLRGLSRDLVSRFFNLEEGLTGTLRDMLVRPGEVIRRYIGGSRRRYVNPFTYLILGAGLALLSFDLFRVDDLMPIYEAQARQSASALPFSPEQQELFVQLQLAPSRYTSLVLLCLAAPFMLLLRLFFPGGRLNLAEAGVFALYMVGQIALLDSVSNGLLVGRGVTAEIVTTVGVMLVVACQVGWSYCRRLWGMSRVVLAYFLAYFGLIIGYGILMTVVTFLLA